MVYSIMFKGKRWYLHKGRNAEIYFFAKKIDKIGNIPLNLVPSGFMVKKTKNFPVLKRK